MLNPQQQQHSFNGFLQDNLDNPVPQRYTILDFTEAEMMGWSWHQLDHIQVIYTSLQPEKHASTSSLRFLLAGCSFCHPINSVNALKG